MKILYFLATGLAIAFTQMASAQCAMYPVSIEQRIQQSDMIVEGTIIDQHSFRSETDGHIYTANTISITKIFKGSPLGAEITLLSPGGQIGDEGETLMPSLYVRKGIYGMFFLYNGKITFPEVAESYQPYSGPQGCIYYDLFSGTARDVFTNYTSIEEVYKNILQNTGGNFKSLQALPSIEHNQESTPVINSLTPDVMRAGTGDILTIRGNGFGTSKGSGTITFRNASSGPMWIEPYSQDYISWSDTLLEVRVPSDAGTGGVRVVQGGGAIFNQVTLRFAQLNIDRDNFGSPTVHINQNGSGGFTWQMSPGFNANTDAKDSYIRALENWSDHSCINWQMGSVTSVDEDIQDNVNNVRFGATDELPSGVLAHTRNYWKYCASSFAYTSEIDMSYDPDINWNYDASAPALTQYDIESVSVHELGHAHQLGHVIDENDFMHYAIGPGTMKRDFNNNNVVSGNYTMGNNIQTHSCGPAPMTMKASCTPAVGLKEQSRNETNFSYPNPFSDRLNIPMANAETTVRIYDVYGRMLSELVKPAGETSVTWTPDQGVNGGFLLIIREDSKGTTSTEKVVYRP